MPASSLTVLVAAGLAGGAVLGVGLERAGVLSPLGEPAPVEVRADRVPVLDCPGGSVVAGLVRGDRVLATGRSADGAWVEIRSPVALDQPAWMAGAALRGERSFGDLPVQECERQGSTTTSSTSTSSSTTSTSSTTTTSTTEPSADATAGPATTSTSTTTATSIPDPPHVTSLEADAAQIVERLAAGQQPACPTSPLPDRTTYTATVAPPTAGLTATLEFSVDSANGQVAMSPDGLGRFTATVGPFGADTTASPVPVAVRVVLIDGQGVELGAFPPRATPAHTGVQLHDCAEGGP